MAEVDPEVRALLDAWARHAVAPAGELTAAAVREDDLGVLALQREPGTLHAVEDLEVPGPGGTLAVRV